MDNSKLTSRFLDVIENNILPLTRGMVEKGHNIFGGAVLKAHDLSLVTVGTNMRGMVPTFHGEMVTIQNFFMDENRFDPAICFSWQPMSHAQCALRPCVVGLPEDILPLRLRGDPDDFRMGDDLRILAEIFSTTVPSRSNSFSNLSRSGAWSRTSRKGAPSWRGSAG